MPPTANGARYSPSVQFIRQATLRNEACRHKPPNGREQASAWVSAARLPANAPCLPRLPGAVSLRTGSIGALIRRLMLRLCRIRMSSRPRVPGRLLVRFVGDQAASRAAHQMEPVQARQHTPT